MIRGIMWAHRGRIALIALGRMLLGAEYIVFVLAMREIINSAAAGELSGLWRAGAVLFFLTLFRIVLRYAVRWLNASTQDQVIRHMRASLYTDILQKKQRELSAYHSTVLLARLTGDLPNLVYYPVTAIPDYAGSLTGLLCAIGTLFSLNQFLPAALIGAGLLIGGAGRLIQRRVKDNYRAFSEANEQANAYYQESMSNSLMLKVFRAQPYAVQRAETFEKGVFGKWKHWYLFSQLLKSGVGAFFQIGYLGAMLLCAVLMYRGVLAFGDMMAILQLVGEIQDPFSSIGDLLSARYSAQTSAERLLEVESLPNEPAEQMEDGWALYRDMTSLSAENVCFGYGERPVLTGASASLQKGDFVVISGRSGIGKSTLLMLLLGVYEDFTGTLSLVTSSGEHVPLNAKTRSLFSYVPQKHMVFSGTVRENLCFLCGPASDADIWAAARLADAEEFLRALPDGLDTRLMEQGAGLSEGQAQRLAIARALLRRAPILVLDEATSALDEETEARVLKNLRGIKDATLLVISHRRAAFALADREWRVADGRIEGREIKR